MPCPSPHQALRAAFIPLAVQCSLQTGFAPSGDSPIPGSTGFYIISNSTSFRGLLQRAQVPEVLVGAVNMSLRVWQWRLRKPQHPGYCSHSSPQPRQAVPASAPDSQAQRARIHFQKHPITTHSFQEEQINLQKHTLAINKDTREQHLHLPFLRFYHQTELEYKYI